MRFLAIVIALIFNTCRTESSWPYCDDGTVYNGYWWYDEIFVPGYIDADTWFSPQPALVNGKAVYYSEGLMRATAEYRGLSLDGYVGGVAMLSPADIGQEIWIFFDNKWRGPFLVVDCARRGDMWPVAVYYEEVVEVGWNTAERWGILDDFPIVTVSKIPPGEINYHRPLVYSDWFLGTAEYDNWYHSLRYHFKDGAWWLNGEWHNFLN